MKEITQFAPAEWQNVSQCFSVDSSVGMQMKNRIFRRKKREIAALETAAAKIELDLNWLSPE